MTSADSSKVDQRFLANAMASFLQIGALLILLIMCFNIVRPFIGIMVWALAMPVRKSASILKRRNKLLTRFNFSPLASKYIATVARPWSSS